MESLKILVVDDEARMRKLVKDFLTNKGFHDFTESLDPPYLQVERNRDRSRNHPGLDRGHGF